MLEAVEDEQKEGEQEIEARGIREVAMEGVSNILLYVTVLLDFR